MAFLQAGEFSGSVNTSRPCFGLWALTALERWGWRVGADGCAWRAGSLRVETVRPKAWGNQRRDLAGGSKHFVPELMWMHCGVGYNFEDEILETCLTQAALFPAPWKDRHSSLEGEI